MIFRPQRGGLEESVRDQVTLTCDVVSLAKHLDVPIADIGCQFYFNDDRLLEWNTTYLITIKGNAVGFTNKHPWGCPSPYGRY